MGLQSGSDMTATITDLSVIDVLLVLLKIDRITGELPESSSVDATSSATVTSNKMNAFKVSLKPLRADVDISWIVRKVTKYIFHARKFFARYL